jgi:hypothetical protein
VAVMGWGFCLPAFLCVYSCSIPLRRLAFNWIEVGCCRMKKVWNHQMAVAMFNRMLGLDEVYTCIDTYFYMATEGLRNDASSLLVRLQHPEALPIIYNTANASSNRLSPHPTKRHPA